MDRRYTRRAALGILAGGLAGCGSAPRETATGGEETASGGSTVGTTAEDDDGGGGLFSSTDTVVQPEYDTSLDHDVTAWDGYDTSWEPPTDAPGEVEVETLVENLEIAWDIAFTPNGEAFVTERTGRLLRYREGEVVNVTQPTDAIDAGSIPPGSDESSWWVKGGEGGTLGTTVHPNYPDVPLVYVYYTIKVGPEEKRNRVAYFDVSADDPGRHYRVLAELPAGKFHNGGRITFGPDNYLWVTTGETGTPQKSQDPDWLGGKILRLTPEGEPAPDNPDIDGGDPRVYTWGHRNPQGIVWLPDGTAVIDEHGGGPDEVNVLTPGANYGWPTARQPEEYRNNDFHVPVTSTVFEETWAPSGSLFYTGDAVPSWQNRMLVGCLASQEVTTVTFTRPDGELPPLGDTGTRHDADWLDDRFTATTHDRLTDVLGRVRHLEQGPDGELYAVTSNRDGRAGEQFPTERDDRLVRLRPK
ncbi:MAG: sorbosone dehydrogenase family protein [Halobaculum sp.]